MWPFTRKPDASQPSGPPTPALPQIRFEWKSVPPIQRLIADHPLTVPTEPFAKEMATHQDPRAVAEPLGHQVSLEAPRGLVLGIAQPQTRGDGPELVPLPRPSRRSEVQRAMESPAESPASSETADIESPSMVGSAESTVRQLPISAALVQRTPLTTVGPQNAPTPLPPSKDIVVAGTEPAREAETIEAAEPLPALPRLTLGQSRRLGLGAPIARIPDTSVQRAAERAATLPAATSPAPAFPEVEDPPFMPIFPLDFPSPKPVVAPAPISRPQRISASLPLARSASSAESPAPEPDAMATTSAQRSASDATAATPTPAGGEPQGSPPSEPEMTAPIVGPLTVSTSGDPRTTRLDEPAKGEWEGTGVAPLQPLPLAGTNSATLPAEESETLDLSPTVATGAGEAPPPLSGVPPRMAPLLSARPLMTTAVQRAPETVPSSVGGAVADSVPGGLGGIRLHRGEAAMKATAIGARAFTERDDIYLPTAYGSLSDSPARSLLAHELVHVGQQRRYGSALPGEHSAEGRRLEADAEVVERSVATGAEMPLAHAAGPMIQSSTAVLEAPAAWTSSTSVQRAPESFSTSPAVAQAPTEFSAAQPAPAAAASPMNDERQLDELAGKLYDKIRSRLRNELLVDRERAGFLTDLR